MTLPFNDLQSLLKVLSLEPRVQEAQMDNCSLNELAWAIGYVTMLQTMLETRMKIKEAKAKLTKKAAKSPSTTPPKRKTNAKGLL